MAHDVFISHSAKNKTTADAVCAMLESVGIRCWIAPRDVLPGMEWGECIIDAIEQTRVMVLIFTADANASPQIRREVERAVNHGVAILPLRMEDVLPGKALEYFIGNVHWLDAIQPPLEAHLEQVAGTIKTLLARIPREPNHPPAARTSAPGLAGMAAPDSSSTSAAALTEAMRAVAEPPEAPEVPPLASDSHPADAKPQGAGASRGFEVPQAAPGQNPRQRKFASLHPWLAAWIAVVAGGALLVIGLIVWPRAGAPPEDVTPLPLISTGNSCCPTFSPDGTKVAFGWTGEQDTKWEIYVEQIGAPGNPIKLTASPPGVYWGAIDAAWSPDDRWIAYRRNRLDGGSDLILIPPMGGAERWVADWSGTVNPPGWSPDGKWLAFPQKDSPMGTSIWAIAIDTGERRRLTTFPATLPNGAGQAGSSGTGKGLGDGEPSFSPDGRSLAFCRVVNDSVYELYVQPLTRDLRPAGEPKLVTSQEYPYVDGNPQWTADGRSLVYSAGVPGFLWQVRVSGKQAPRRLSYPAAALQPAIARKPPRLAYPWWITNVNLWRLDVRTGERRPFIGSNPAVWDRNVYPQYSPDGRRIAFGSSRSGSNEIWTCDADGMNCQQLTSFRGPYVEAPRWSPDSRWIALDSRASGNAELYVIAADGGAPRRMTNTRYDNVLPSWSHDGRWIDFASDRSGRYEVWRIPREGGDAIQVTHAGGYASFESPDGKYLYYTKFNPEGPTPLFRMPAGGGVEVQVIPGIESWQLFCVTSKGVYFIPSPPGANTIRFLDAASGKVSTVATLARPASAGLAGLTPAAPVAGGLAVSPDGAYIVWSQLDRDTLDLMMVEGFH
jgi:Tol biopolymer transport system component